MITQLFYVFYIYIYHAFTRCDITSVVLMFGKIFILFRLKASSKLLKINDQFYVEDTTVEDIGNVTICFFQLYITKN